MESSGPALGATSTSTQGLGTEEPVVAMAAGRVVLFWKAGLELAGKVVVMRPIAVAAPFVLPMAQQPVEEGGGGGWEAQWRTKDRKRVVEEREAIVFIV